MKAFKKIIVCVMAMIAMLSCSVGGMQLYASEVEEPNIETQSLLKGTSNTDLILQVTKGFGISKKGIAHYSVSVLADGELTKKTEVTVVFQRYNKTTKKWEKGLTFYTPREESFASTSGDIKLSRRGKYRLKVTARVTPYKGKAQSFTSYSDSDTW